MITFSSGIILMLVFNVASGPFPPLVLVIIVFIQMFISIYGFSNVTSYSIVSIPLSEYEILDSGSKEFRFNVDSMIYGDENSSENISIINSNIEFKLPKLKEGLLKERQKKSEEQKNHLLKIEEEFERDKWKDLKSKLPVLKNSL